MEQTRRPQGADPTTRLLPELTRNYLRVRRRFPRMHPATAWRTVLRAAGLVAATSTLSGCFAIFIPGALVDKVAGKPAYCVDATHSQVGAKIRVGDGPLLRVTEVKGKAPYFCRAQPEGRRWGVEAEELPS